jgi:hypothetical protein
MRPDRDSSTRKPLKSSNEVSNTPNIYDYKPEEWVSSGDVDVDKKQMITSIFDEIKSEEKPLFYKVGSSMINVGKFMYQ